MRQLPDQEVEEATFRKGGQVSREGRSRAHSRRPLWADHACYKRWSAVLPPARGRLQSLHVAALLTSKDEVVAAIKKFKTRAEAESGKKLHVLRTDRGGEFTSVEFTAYCTDQGVGQHHTAPYSPQQNGVVER